MKWQLTIPGKLAYLGSAIMKIVLLVFAWDSTRFSFFAIYKFGTRHCCYDLKNQLFIFVQIIFIGSN